MWLSGCTGGTAAMIRSEPPPNNTKQKKKNIAKKTTNKYEIFTLNETKTHKNKKSLFSKKLFSRKQKQTVGMGTTKSPPASMKM